MQSQPTSLVAWAIQQDIERRVAQRTRNPIPRSGSWRRILRRRQDGPAAAGRGIMRPWRHGSPAHGS